MSSNFSKNLTSSMGISLGGLEVVTDFLFTNPEFYESDIADVKSTMYGQPVAKQHYEKPVRPKKTKEAIMNKFSIIQHKPVIQSDEIFESPIIASEDTSFDDSFDDMEMNSNNENNKDKDNENDAEILEANALLQKLSNIQNSGDMSAISSALDIDDEDDDDDINIVDDDSDDDSDEDSDDDDLNIIDDDESNDSDDGLTIIEDDDDFNIVDEDSDDDDLNIVDDDDDINIVDDDSDEDTYGLDDINIADNNNKIADNNNNEDDINIVDDDDDINIVDDNDDINIVDDDDEEYDTDDDEETFDLDDLDIKEPSNSNDNKKDTNAVSTEKLNEKEEAVLSDYENNFSLNNNKQETKDNKKDSENEELKLMQKRFAELEKQLHDLQNEKASNNTSNLVENNNKDLKTDSIDSIIEKAKHKKAESDTKNDASEDIHLKYTCMSVESLYKEVKDYMNELGVKQKVIDVSTLNTKFGEKNIKKLIQKSYLIKIGSKGVTTGR